MGQLDPFHLSEQLNFNFSSSIIFATSSLYKLQVYRNQTYFYFFLTFYYQLFIQRYSTKTLYFIETSLSCCIYLMFQVGNNGAMESNRSGCDKYNDIDYKYTVNNKMNKIQEY